MFTRRSQIGYWQSRKIIPPQKLKIAWLLSMPPAGHLIPLSAGQTSMHTHNSVLVGRWSAGISGIIQICRGQVLSCMLRTGRMERSGINQKWQAKQAKRVLASLDGAPMERCSSPVTAVDSSNSIAWVLGAVKSIQYI